MFEELVKFLKRSEKYLKKKFSLKSLDVSIQYKN